MLLFSSDSEAFDLEYDSLFQRMIKSKLDLHANRLDATILSLNKESNSNPS